MNNATSRDPWIKNDIRGRLESLLYQPVAHQLHKTLDTLIMRNAMVSGYAHMSFTYKGEYYTCEDMRVRGPLKRNRLHPEFHAAMDEYLAEMEEIERVEKPLVMGFIVKTLNICSLDLLALMKILPESTHKTIKMALGNYAPMHADSLLEEQIQEYIKTEQASIDRIKRRMATNLLY